MPAKPTPDRFLNYAEVAEMIGLHWTTIRDGKCETNEIPRIKLGGRVLFSFNTVQNWMAVKNREAEEAKRRQEMVVVYLMAKQRRNRKSVMDTYISIVREQQARRRK